MTIILGFDVYGTLIDTAGIAAALQQFVGDNTQRFSSVWREKQLEYSFRRGLMQNYRKFGICTRDALDYTCRMLNVAIAPADKDSLMQQYRKLPPFDDAVEALPLLESAGFVLFAFSNGPAEDVTRLLKNCGILHHFKDVVSTDEIKSFKPNPAVYAHFLRRAKGLARDSWLISGNPFDVIGALSAGMMGAWVKRTENAIFDPWEFEPTITVRSLIDLEQEIKEAC